MRCGADSRVRSTGSDHSAAAADREVGDGPAIAGADSVPCAGISEAGAPGKSKYLSWAVSLTHRRTHITLEIYLTVSFYSQAGCAERQHLCICQQQSSTVRIHSI